jgi:hypothetical protein
VTIEATSVKKQSDGGDQIAERRKCSTSRIASGQHQHYYNMDTKEHNKRPF